VKIIKSTSVLFNRHKSNNTLNKEMEGKKQNQLESEDLNELKYKYAEEKQKNEELNVYLLHLQNNMISSTVGLNKDQPSNKVNYVNN